MKEHSAGVEGARIIDNKGAPPELVRIANYIIEEYERVDLILFDAFIKDLKGNCGGYNPDNNFIVIDMGVCLTKRDWMAKGIMYIPNVWFNLLTALFHEAAHAIQLEDDPTLAAVNALPAQYEKEACKIAWRALFDWTKENDVPSLNEMSWVGSEIKKILNKAYTQTPGSVIEELDLERTGAAANALHVALIDGGEEYKTKLFNSIDTGESGIKINGKRYLTTHEAVTYT